ncbi:hypothetical protein ACOMHN_049019 [Nucella lapillus]
MYSNLACYVLWMWALFHATEALVGETELPGSNRFIESNQADVRIDPQRLSTVLEASKDLTESAAAKTEVGKTEDSDVQSDSKPGCGEEGKTDKDVGGDGKPRLAEKPAVKPKPALMPKPSVTQKPVVLPKPQLLSKPELPYRFSEQAPEVVSGGDEDQAVFTKAPGTAPKDRLSSSKTGDAQQAQMVQKGLCTGNFDMKNVQMLRTCSEPDLTRLFRSAVHCVKGTLRRHHSLDLSQEMDADQPEDDLSVKSPSPRQEAGNSSESPELLVKGGEKTEGNTEETNNEEEDGEEEGKDEDAEDEEEEDEDEDFISMRETMQSLLLDDDDDDGDDDGALSPKIKFSLSSDAETTLKDDHGDDDDNAVAADDDDDDELHKQYEKLQKDDATGDDDDDDDDDDLTFKTVCPRSPMKSKSDSALCGDEGAGGEAANNGEDNGADDDDDDDDEEGSEKVLYCTADILTLNDSDEETEFGDDDEDLDLFSRLEQQREELERDLGFERFIHIYKTVQALRVRAP